MSRKNNFIHSQEFIDYYGDYETAVKALIAKNKLKLDVPNSFSDKDEILPIGFKSGCLTIVDGFKSYIEENSSSVCYNQDYTFYYKCKCTCGRIVYVNTIDLIKKTYRYCDSSFSREKFHQTGGYTKLCKRRTDYNEETIEIQNNRFIKKYENDLSRIKNPYEGKEYLLNIKRSSSIVIDEKIPYKSVRKSSIVGDNKKYIFNSIRCKCHCDICNTEYDFDLEDFEITHGWGYNSTYKCNAQCTNKNCIKGNYWELDSYHDGTSSFEWRTVLVLQKMNINYKVEYSFADLPSLRFDFAIFDELNNLLFLVECQGRQHYEICREYGQTRSDLTSQQYRDNLKREYCSSHNIPLCEIKFNNSSQEAIEKKIRKYLN